MKPLLEKVPVIDGMSWAMLDRSLEDAIPFQWHHHPEFELTLTLNSRGQRFIGDHIGAYDDGDLVLVGPNLPHTWASSSKIDQATPHSAKVLWFRGEWAEKACEAFVELRPVRAMLARASNGLRFSEPASSAARPLVERLFHLPAAERLAGLLTVLANLAVDTGAIPLASRAPAAETVGADRSRIDRVLDRIHIGYAEELSLDELASVAALSVSGLHRLFRRHTHFTITGYIQRLRIGEACALLSGARQPVAHIADAVGYRSLANFNRQFRAVKGMTPREYRARFG